MNKKLLIFVLLSLILMMSIKGQETIYRNVKSTDYIYGKNGVWKQEKYNWKIKMNGSEFILTSSLKTIKVEYFTYDIDKNLYVYRIKNNNHEMLLTSNKLSDVSRGIVNDVIITIINDLKLKGESFLLRKF